MIAAPFPRPKLRLVAKSAARESITEEHEPPTLMRTCQSDIRELAPDTDREPMPTLAGESLASLVMRYEQRPTAPPPEPEISPEGLIAEAKQSTIEVPTSLKDLLVLGGVLLLERLAEAKRLHDQYLAVRVGFVVVCAVLSSIVTAIVTVNLVS